MAASRGVIRADNEQEFIRTFHRIAKLLRHNNDHTESILVEEYLPNWEVAVEGMVTDGKLRVLTIFDKPDSPQGPTFPESIYVTPSNLTPESQQRITQITQQAVTALQLTHGPIHAELRGSPQRPALLEIAARSIGGHCSKVLHFNGAQSLEELILRHALAEPVDHITLEETASGVMMIQPHTEGIFQQALGLEKALAVPHIVDGLISAHPGQKILSLPEGFGYLGFLFARAETSQQVIQSLQQAHKELEFVITPGQSKQKNINQLELC